MNASTIDKTGLKWLYGGVILFALIGVYGIVHHLLWVYMLPLFLLIVVAGLYRLEYLMFFSVFVTPLSINLSKTELGIGVSLPSEPLIFGIMILFLLKYLYESEKFKELLFHPVSLAILLHLFWMMVTSISSSMFFVSVKATLARFCFVIVFYYMGTLVFRKMQHIKLFLWCYMAPLLVVIFYTTYMHYLTDFSEKGAHTAMVPFYNDHTAYAAVIAMFIPLLFGFSVDKSGKSSFRIISFITLLIFIFAIVLSYTRASWISLVAALFCYFIFVFRIKTSIVISSISLFVIMFFFFQTQIVMELEQNEKESSSDFTSHLQSMSNISTDASNVERINRWNSAFRMFNERPLLGWGPGTYMFQYAPFQKWSERTIISTNFGEGGNAHSEYIGPLAEQGIFGPLVFIFILVVVVFRASRLIIYSENSEVRILAKGLVLGLVTYWVHGLLNNFLDTEKAAVPFWGFIGALVALEMYHNEKSSSQLSKSIISFLKKPET